jgi:nucleolar protein 12
MSLSTLLLGADTTGKKSSKGKEKEKAAGLDDGLDALFKTTVRSCTVTISALHSDKYFQTSAAALASSLKALAVGDATAKASKRKHATEPDEGASSSATASTKRHRKDKSSAVEPTLATEPSKQVKIKSRKSAASENKLVEHSNEDMTPLAAPPAYDASDSAPSDQEDSLSTLVHESVSGKTIRPSSRKTKYVPEGETPSQRDQRTIFLGNIPLEVVKSRVSDSSYV